MFLRGQRKLLPFYFLLEVIKMSGLALQPDLQSIRDFEGIFEDVQPYIHEFPDYQNYQAVSKITLGCKSQNVNRKIKIDVDLEELKNLNQSLSGFIRPKFVLIFIAGINFSRQAVEDYWEDFSIETQETFQKVAYKVLGRSPGCESSPKSFDFSRKWRRFLWKLSFFVASAIFRVNLFEIYSESLKQFSLLVIQKTECSDSICQLVFSASSVKISQEELASADDLISRVFSEPEGNISSEDAWTRFDKAWTAATKEAQARW